jgi:hypothetical protein
MIQLDPRKTLFGILAFLAGFLMFFALMTSCATPNPKKQKKHWDKFLYYGGKIDTVKQTKTVEILVKGKDGEDSLIYVDVEVEVEKPVIEYKDRWHTRRMDKRERDSLKHVERMLDKQLKHARRMGKQTDKHIEQANQQAIRLAQETTKQIRLEQRNPWVWVLLAAIALAALVLIKFK